MRDCRVDVEDICRRCHQPHGWVRVRHRARKCR